MKNILLPVLLLSSVFTATAQEKKEALRTRNFPVLNGTVTESPKQKGRKAPYSLIFTSTDENVRALTDGDVFSVFKVDDGSKVVIVGFPPDTVLTYAGLSDARVQQGQKIHRGQLLAKSAINSGNKRECTLQIWAGKSAQTQLTNADVIDMIRRFDK
jgi:murein DD-endopeptidase MepM/ murein hydrolase activator NlpD